MLGGHREGPISIGGARIGVSHVFEAGGGAPWSPLGIVNDGFNAIMVGLASGRILAEDGALAGEVPMTTAGALFDVGPSHDSIGHLPGRDPRGAFVMHRLRGGADARGPYRSLWSADGNAQSSMVADPTHRGVPYREEKAAGVWDGRTTLFIARGMRWTSQRVTAAVTRAPAVGGSSWTGLGHPDARVLKAFALWANSVFGMAVILGHGSRAHPGRTRFQVNAIAGLPCPDFGRLGGEALDAAARDFDTLSRRGLRVANEADSDEARAAINAAASEMLGVRGYDAAALAEMWCAEPHVRPGRPRG